MAAAHPGWLSDEDGRRTWPVNRYAIEGERRTDWFAKGVRKYQRRIGTTLNALIDGGFALRSVEEFGSPAAQTAENQSPVQERAPPLMQSVGLEGRRVGNK